MRGSYCSRRDIDGGGVLLTTFIWLCQSAGNGIVGFYYYHYIAPLLFEITTSVIKNTVYLFIYNGI